MKYLLQVRAFPVSSCKRARPVNVSVLIKGWPVGNCEKENYQIMS